MIANERRTTLRREQDRAGCPYLTPEQVEEIADKAAEKASVKVAEKAAVKAVELMTDSMYREIGKGVVNKILWFLGVASVLLYFWWRDKGIL